MSKDNILDKNNLPEKRKLSPYMKDITGLKFGQLTAIYPSIYQKPDKSVLWVCQCDCGEYTLRAPVDLRRKGEHHCSATIHNKLDMQNYAKKLREELNGTKNNWLEVIDFDHIEEKRIFLKCKCLKCGNICVIRKDSFINGHASSCGCIKSKGEQQIKTLLSLKQIDYKTEYKFNDLQDQDKLRFDFALFKNQILMGLIEFQGKQHFNSNNSGWNNEEHLKLTKYHDNMKHEYCIKNNIKLYYITYQDNIEQKIEEIINELYSK